MYVLQHPLSHGQRKLVDLLDNRSLKPFCREKEIAFHYTYLVATGKQTPPPKQIWILRDCIHPALWFYNEDEPYETLDFKIKHSKENVDETIAMLDFRKKTLSDLRTISQEHDIKYHRLYCIYNGRFKPSFAVIKELMVLYKPELWFMYPDELKKVKK